MVNDDLRQLAKDNNVRLWQVASEYGITDGNFSRKLRRELSEQEKQKITQIILRLSKAGVAS